MCLFSFTCWYFYDIMNIVSHCHFFKIIINSCIIFQDKDIPYCISTFLSVWSGWLFPSIVPKAVQSCIYSLLPASNIILKICCQFDRQNSLSLIHISLITNQDKYYFACLLVILFQLLKIVFMLSAYFFNGEQDIYIVICFKNMFTYEKYYNIL